MIDFELAKVRHRLLERGLNLELTDLAKEFLVKKGSNLDYGARPLRRALEQRIEDPLSEELLRGAFENHDTIIVDAIAENEDGKKVASSKVSIKDDGKIVGPKGVKVKLVRLDFKGESRGLPEDKETVGATSGESTEDT